MGIRAVMCDSFRLTYWQYWHCSSELRSGAGPLADPDVLHLLPILPEDVKQGLQALCEPMSTGAQYLLMLH